MPYGINFVPKMPNFSYLGRIFLPVMSYPIFTSSHNLVGLKSRPLVSQISPKRLFLNSPPHKSGGRTLYPPQSATGSGGRGGGHGQNIAIYIYIYIWYGPWSAGSHTGSGVPADMRRQISVIAATPHFTGLAAAFGPWRLGGAQASGL